MVVLLLCNKQGKGRPPYSLYAACYYAMNYVYNLKCVRCYMKKFYILLLLLILPRFIYSQNPCPGVTSFDYAGRTYHTVNIGSQCWLKENMNVGTMIQGNQGQTDNGILEKYCYNNDTANCSTYGALYQWREALLYNLTPGSTGICPPGWHVPVRSEFTALSSTTHGDANALITIGQGAGTNISGFSAFLTGVRSDSGKFINAGNNATFWSSTPYFYFMDLNQSTSAISINTNPMTFGYNIRCAMDSLPAPVPQTPSMGAVDIAIPPKLTWTEFTGAVNFIVQVSTDNLFSSLVYSDSTITTNSSKQIFGLFNKTTYYWRVKGFNSHGYSDWSIVSNFTTRNQGGACREVPVVLWQGRSYNTVQIENQCWLRDNLNAGTAVAWSQDQVSLSGSNKSCLYDDTNNCNIYGGYYQWYEMTDGSREPAGGQGICPAATHIPSRAEFAQLAAAVNNDGNALRAAGQNGGTNTSGFNALASPAGYSEFWFNELDYGYIPPASFSEIISGGIIQIGEGSVNQKIPVRCLLDQVSIPSLSTPPNLATDVDWATVFSWSGQYGSHMYSLEVATDSLFFNIVYSDTNITTTSRQVPKLNLLTKYFWHVRSRNQYYSTGWGATRSFTTRGAPIAPGITAPSNGATEINQSPLLQWNSIPWAISYKLQVATDSSFKNIIINDTGLTITTRPMYGLPMAATYYWHVLVINPLGTSAWSGTSHFTTTAMGTPCKGLPYITYAGETYYTVQVGNQCWLKQNLNYGTMVNGSQNQLNNNIVEKYCYDNDTNNCHQYGGLYQWREAMQYAAEPGAKGICPTGWHIPVRADFDTLSATVKSVGNELVTKTYWNGKNSVGFTAFFSGLRTDTASFVNIGNHSTFWSSTPYFYFMDLGEGGGTTTVTINTRAKEYGLSIRCIMDSIPILEHVTPANGTMHVPLNMLLTWKDYTGAISTYSLQIATDSLFASIVYRDSLIAIPSEKAHNLQMNTKYFWRVKATNTHGSSNWTDPWSITTGTQGGPCPGIPTVTYAGKIYNTVQIEHQCWLKENLNLGTMINWNSDQTNNSILEKYCLQNDTNNCNTYGAAYQWGEAMQYASTPGAQGICPSGWHIPKLDEYQTLAASVGGDANALKAESQNGTNASGFSALLNSGTTFFWTSSPTYYFMELMDTSTTIYLPTTVKGYQFGIRCINNNIISATGAQNILGIPKEFALKQNYPNPFNPTTRIEYALPDAGRVKLEIFAISGQLIRTLVNGHQDAGYYTVDFSGKNLSSGMYVYKLTLNDRNIFKKMLFLK